jgi:hypothetical protein
VRYIYRGYRDASTLAAVADCRIPATPSALARISRKLGVSAPLRTDASTRLFSDFALAPVVAVACGPGYIGEYPACYPVRTPTTGAGEGDGGDFWSGGEGGGGNEGETSGEESDQSDEVPIDEIPDCTQPQTERWALAFCRAARPQGTRLEWTKDALDRISKRGEECARIAAFGAQLLSEGRLQFFEWQDGDKAGWGNVDIGALLADFWVDDFGDPQGRSTPSFDNKLVHEIEHAMGRPHVEYNQTPNSLACDGL